MRIDCVLPHRISRWLMVAQASARALFRAAENQDGTG